MDKSVIASRLKELRESLKLSQAKVASLNGTTTHTSLKYLLISSSFLGFKALYL